MRTGNVHNLAMALVDEADWCMREKQWHDALELYELASNAEFQVAMAIDVKKKPKTYRVVRESARAIREKKFKALDNQLKEEYD